MCRLANGKNRSNYVFEKYFEHFLFHIVADVLKSNSTFIKFVVYIIRIGREF